MVEDDLVKLVVGVIVAVILIPIILMALFVPFGMAMGPMNYGIGGMVGLFAFVPFLVLILIGWVVYRLVTQRERPDPAIRELREAYARGDITSEEFEERIERLTDREQP